MGAFYLDEYGKKKRVHAFVMVMGYSNVEFIENEKLQTLIECHERAFKFFGGVPKNIVYDYMRTVVKNIRAQGLERFYKTFLAFAKHQDFRPVPSRACHPQTKGKYWLETTANTRTHDITYEVHKERLAKESLKPLSKTSIAYRTSTPEKRFVSEIF